MTDVTTERPPDLLVVDHVTHRFGGVTALDDCSWAVASASMVGLIGPNGAGKSTLVSVISGALRLQSGEVTLSGSSTKGLTPHRVAERGLIRTFQVPRVFPKLTVIENMLVAPLHQPGESLWRAVLTPGSGKVSEKRWLKRAGELLGDFDLYELRNEYASNLSGGQQKLLELARAAMCDPKLLVLDEPMAAVSPVLVDRLCEHLQRLHSSGVTLLLVEHNLEVVERICEQVTVMVMGRVLATGSMAELRREPAVVNAYLGGEAQ